MRKRLLLFSTLIFPLVLLFSCTEGPVGIFASIESEIQRDLDLGFADNSTVSSVFRVGDKYVAASGRVYIRSATAETAGEGAWSRIAGPTGYDVAADVAPLGSTVYGALSSTDGTNSRLFTLDPAAADPSWSEATTTGLESIDGASGLHPVSVGGTDELYLVATVESDAGQAGGATVKGYSLYFSTDGSGFT